MHGHQGPIRDDTGDAQGAVRVGAGDEVFDSGGIEELDVGEGEDLGEEGGGEEGLWKVMLGLDLGKRREESK